MINSTPLCDDAGAAVVKLKVFAVMISRERYNDDVEVPTVVRLLLWCGRCVERRWNVESPIVERMVEPCSGSKMDGDDVMALCVMLLCAKGILVTIEVCVVA